MDHCDAYATLACPSTFVGQRAGISVTIQVLSSSDDEHFLMVARYVERNAPRAGLVDGRNTSSGRVCGGFCGRIGRPSQFLRRALSLESGIVPGSKHLWTVPKASNLKPCAKVT